MLGAGDRECWGCLWVHCVLAQVCPRVPMHVPLGTVSLTPHPVPRGEVKGVGGAKVAQRARGCTLRCGDGTPPDSFPHTAARGYKPALQGRPFLPGKEVRDPVSTWLWGSPGLPNPPRQCCASQPGYHVLWSCLVRVPWPALCLCPCSMTPAHGAPAQLTLGPGSPADPRCPAWRESHCKERMCGVTRVPPP